MAKLMHQKDFLFFLTWPAMRTEKKQLWFTWFFHMNRHSFFIRKYIDNITPD